MCFLFFLLEVHLKLKISKKAMRISCFQVLPGTESEVVEQLRNIYKGSPHAICKGFGGFDIVLIHSAQTFDSFKNNDINISSILKISHFPCFSYQIDDVKKVIDAISAATFVGFSLIKLNSEDYKNYAKVKHDIIDKILNNKPDITRFVLGTLGWYEIVVVSLSNNISELVKDILRTTAQEDKLPLSKTFSIVSINYNILSNLSVDTLSYESINKQLASISGFDEKVGDGNDIKVQVSIASRPDDTNSIIDFWNMAGFNTSLQLGKEDILAIPKNEITISELLTNLIIFRKGLSTQILSTNVKIFKTCDENPPPTAPKIIFSSVTDKTTNINYSYEEYKTFFGKDAAIKLLQILDYLASLRENPIIGDAFSDVMLYVRSINRLVKEGNKEIGSELHIASKAAAILKYGAEVRFQGTYASIEEPTSQFSLIKGGVQRVFLAIEGLVSSVLARQFGAGWEGFVITSEEKFSNINEIINVPIDAMHYPKDWWALYHEIGHIFIDFAVLLNGEKLVGLEVRPIQTFLANKAGHESSYLTLINELAAEIIGFEIGFFGDLKLFISLVWKYLDQVNQAEKQTDYDQYLVRTFVVEIYCNYVKKSNVEAFTDLDAIYKMFIKHIKKVEVIIERTIDRKYYIAANNIRCISDLIPYLIYVKTFLGEFKLPKRSEISRKNTKDVVALVIEGTVWLNDISCPEAVLYKLLSTDNLDFRTSVAFTLSLWNMERTRQMEFR